MTGDSFDRELSQLLTAAHTAEEARQRDAEIPLWALLLLRGIEGTRRDVEELRQTILHTRERAA